MAAKMKIKPWFCLRLGSSLLLILWLIHKIDFREVWEPITSNGWIYLSILFVLLNVDRILMSYKWQILLKAKGIAIPFADIVRGYFFSTFWGIFLPSTVGGDVIRAYRIAKEAKSKKDIVSSVIMERILGAATGLMMTFICLVAADVFMDVFDWRIVLGMFFFLILFVCVVFISFHGRLRYWLEEASITEREGFWGKLARLYQSYQEYGSCHGALLRFLGWTILEQCVPIVGVYLTAIALGKDLPFLHVAIFIPVIMTFTKIPISLDGYGVREGMYVFLFSLVGVSSGDAFIIGLLSHVAQNLSLLPGFFYSALYVARRRIVEPKPF
jgi:glycosyltransferase 2 family protein